VSARFDGGSITCVEGPNGAGKSTLLGVTGTLVRPSSGEVFYGPHGEPPEVARQELGWMSHEGRTYRDLTGRENVALAARLQGVDPVAGYRRVSEKLGLAAFADQPVSTLSRGQRQRIALGRALVHEPSLLLLDEPLTGLDAESAERVERLLVEERERGAIIVVVNHVSGFADRLGAKRLRLERGRVVSQSPAG